MKKHALLPKQKRLLKTLGENLRLARLRRKLTTEMLAERASIGRTTLWSLEKGEANVSLETLLKVLVVLGLEQDLLMLAKDDELGRKLQDLDLLK